MSDNYSVKANIETKKSKYMTYDEILENTGVYYAENFSNLTFFVVRNSHGESSLLMLEGCHLVLADTSWKSSLFTKGTEKTTLTLEFN